jgi:UDP-N-acetylmuramate dehydrogenase
VVKEDKDAVELHVGAGITWDNFVDYCVKRRWYGAENLSLIPGEVGAAAVQNIGSYGVEVKDLIRSVETIDIHGRKCIYDVNECHYAYRKSLFKLPEMKSVFVTNVNFRLSTKEHYTLEYGAIREELTKYPSTDLETVRKVIIDIRKRKLPDPKQIGNAGSFFMNPIVSRERFESLKKEYSSMPHYEIDANSVKIPAGWLIEQCGWKGKSMGRAGVYDKQALVLVNLGGATGHEIAALSDAIRESVHVKFGINILPEVNFID